MDTSIIISICGVLVSALVAFITSNIRIGEYKNKVDTLCNDIIDLKKESRENSGKLVECSTKIDERTRSYASTLTKRESPVSLTPVGKDLLSQSGSDKFVLDNQSDLVEKIKAKSPKSAFDVQVFSRQVVEEIQNEERFKPLKDFAYNEGYDLEPIFIVMGLYLRDIALPLLNYKLEEVDKYDPENKPKTE